MNDCGIVRTKEEEKTSERLVVSEILVTQIQRLQNKQTNQPSGL